MQPYNDVTLAYFENPRDVGELDAGSLYVGTGLVGTPAQGDAIQLQIQISAQKTIEAAKFKVYGNPWTVAAMSLLVEKIRGLFLSDVKILTYREVAIPLALPTVKQYVICLVENVLRAAIANYEEKQYVRSVDAHSFNACCDSTLDPLD